MLHCATGIEGEKKRVTHSKIRKVELRRGDVSATMPAESSFCNIREDLQWLA